MGYRRDRRGHCRRASRRQHAIVRVPIGDFAFVSRALDFGAEAIIAPMINTQADARRSPVAKYPGLGERSWGPQRAMALQANAFPPNTCARPMTARSRSP